MNDREQRIRVIAYRIWEEEGQPSDQAERHWRLAEEIVVAEEEPPKDATTIQGDDAPAGAGDNGTEAGSADA